MIEKKTAHPINPLLFILPFSLFGIIIAILIVSATNRPSNSSSLSNEQVAEGKRLYDLKCASCHGRTGEGQYPSAPYRPDKDRLIGAPPHNSTGHTWHHPDSVLVKQIKNGSNI